MENWWVNNLVFYWHFKNVKFAWKFCVLVHNKIVEYSAKWVISAGINSKKIRRTQNARRNHQSIKNGRNNPWIFINVFRPKIVDILQNIQPWNEDFYKIVEEFEKKIFPVLKSWIIYWTTPGVMNFLKYFVALKIIFQIDPTGSSECLQGFVRSILKTLWSRERCFLVISIFN